jgi:hypothetical protein
MDRMANRWEVENGSQLEEEPRTKELSPGNCKSLRSDERFSIFANARKRKLELQLKDGAAIGDFYSGATGGPDRRQNGQGPTDFN